MSGAPRTQQYRVTAQASLPSSAYQGGQKPKDHENLCMYSSAALWVRHVVLTNALDANPQQKILVLGLLQRIAAKSSLPVPQQDPQDLKALFNAIVPKITSNSVFESSLYQIAMGLKIREELDLVLIEKSSNAAFLRLIKQNLHGLFSEGQAHEVDVAIPGASSRIAQIKPVNDLTAKEAVQAFHGKESTFAHLIGLSQLLGATITTSTREDGSSDSYKASREIQNAVVLDSVPVNLLGGEGHYDLQVPAGSPLLSDLYEGVERPAAINVAAAVVQPVSPASAAVLVPQLEPAAAHVSPISLASQVVVPTPPAASPTSPAAVAASTASSLPPAVVVDAAPSQTQASSSPGLFSRLVTGAVSSANAVVGSVASIFSRGPSPLPAAARSSSPSPTPTTPGSISAPSSPSPSPRSVTSLPISAGNGKAEIVNKAFLEAEWKKVKTVSATGTATGAPTSDDVVAVVFQLYLNKYKSDPNADKKVMGEDNKIDVEACLAKLDDKDASEVKSNFTIG